jgi:hypothetical protein
MRKLLFLRVFVDARIMRSVRCLESVENKFYPLPWQQSRELMRYGARISHVHFDKHHQVARCITGMCEFR